MIPLTSVLSFFYQSFAYKIIEKSERRGVVSRPVEVEIVEIVKVIADDRDVANVGVVLTLVIVVAEDGGKVDGSREEGVVDHSDILDER